MNVNGSDRDLVELHQRQIKEAETFLREKYNISIDPVWQQYQTKAALMTEHERATIRAESEALLARHIREWYAANGID